jgi:ABC-type nitrate/sulfonate/bicarbonate transport system substrate-binding protein
MNHAAFIIIALIVAAGCAPVENTPQPSGEVMKVAKYYWPGMYWVEIAESKGWFREAGLNVELIDTNPDYFQSLQDTADGKIVQIWLLSLIRMFQTARKHLWQKKKLNKLGI